jgi:hypothetical protein
MTADFQRQQQHLSQLTSLLVQKMVLLAMKLLQLVMVSKSTYQQVLLVKIHLMYL